MDVAVPRFVSMFDEFECVYNDSVIATVYEWIRDGRSKVAAPNHGGGGILGCTLILLLTLSLSDLSDIGQLRLIPVHLSHETLKIVLEMSTKRTNPLSNTSSSRPLNNGRMSHLVR
jgi:hypothetical protein